MVRNRFDANNGNYFVSCKNCTERHVGCHSACEKYISEKQQYQADKAEYNEAISEYKQLDGYEYKRNTARKREKKRKAMQR